MHRLHSDSRIVHKLTIPLFVGAVLLTIALGPALSAQTVSLTGRWDGTFSMPPRPDGTPGDSDPLQFTFTQKGKELTGALAAEKDESWKVEKGIVEGNKATFEVQQPNGPLLKFTLTLVKGMLEGEVQFVRNGVVRATGKIELKKAK